jgi:uroporphyrinogen decarboxylase
MYRRIIKPFHSKFWRFIKQKTQAYLFFHSCGSVYPLIPDFIEMGLDILNPIQVSARDMNSARLKEEFGDQISFWGAIDTQHVLPYGSPEEVEAEVKQRIKDLAPGGGYVLCAVHDIQPDVKPENIVSMYESARKYGTYPIN